MKIKLVFEQSSKIMHTTEKFALKQSGQSLFIPQFPQYKKNKPIITIRHSTTWHPSYYVHDTCNQNPHNTQSGTLLHSHRAHTRPCTTTHAYSQSAHRSRTCQIHTTLAHKKTSTCAHTLTCLPKPLLAETVTLCIKCFGCQVHVVVPHLKKSKKSHHTFKTEDNHTH